MKLEATVLYFMLVQNYLTRNEVLTNGGRVLNVVGLSSVSLKEAISNSYKNVDKIHFENMYFRKDIGYRALNNKS